MTKILGIHYQHDSAAALVVDGKIIADAAEERFSRIKKDASFPLRAVEFCLKKGGIDPAELDCVALTTTSMCEDAGMYIPQLAPAIRKRQASVYSFVRKIIKNTINRKSTQSAALPLYQKPLVFSDTCGFHLSHHHKAHAASAYYTSGITDKRALVITMDGMGDDISIGIWHGENNVLKPVELLKTDASLGWFYGNATEALGWRHASDEGKTMGLAPYGRSMPGSLNGYHPVFKSGKLAVPHEFSPICSWNDHGAYHYHSSESGRMGAIVEKIGRENFAAEVQNVLEQETMKLILPLLKKYDTNILCCAGGIFLNVKLNQKIWYSGLLETQWIYPDAGDSGLAVGAALDAFYTLHPEVPNMKMDNLYFGPEYSNDEIKTILDGNNLSYRYAENPSREAAEYLAKNKIIGWFQGRMESGPRALGNRSILMSPLNPASKQILNERVKFRESFRPFCPSILFEKSSDYLVNAREELFMITSFETKENKIDKIPAVVHVDKTLRPQMVKREINPRFYELINHFGEVTGEYVMLNTSFNVKGEPIVCSPNDAVRCFYSCGLDVLILNNFIIEKNPGRS